MSDQFQPNRRSFFRANTLTFSWLSAAGLGVTLGAAVFLRPAMHPAPALQAPIPVAAADPRWDRMATSIEELSRSFDGDVGIYIKDLKTGRTYRHNDNRAFITASLIKVPVMAALIREVESGNLRLDQSLKFESKFRREGSGTLRWSKAGTKFTLSQLMWQMITKSDNTATAMVVDLMGYDKLNKYFGDFGLNETRIQPTGMSLASKLSDPSLDNFTTPEEMGMILEKIYRHQIVHNDGLGDLMIEVMKHANAPSRLAKYLPHQWQLARKTGLLRKNCHDIGIVFGPDSDYVICVMTNDSRSYANAKGFISNVGKQAFDYIGRNS